MGSKIVTRPTFQKGDQVKWGSQAGGFVLEKQGTVVAVLPPGMQPLTHCKFDETQFNPDPIDSRTSARNHESYVIMVAAKSAKARPKLYWPVVSMLRKA
jgi:hypothetical protein